MNDDLESKASNPAKAEDTLADMLAICAGLSTYRNFILAGAETLSGGMSPHDSANMRLLGTLTNFFPAGFVYAWGRDFLYSERVEPLLKKHLPLMFNRNKSEEKVHKNIDRLCGLAAMFVDISINYQVYIYLASANQKALIPAAVGALLTAYGTGMGKAIDTARDGFGLPCHPDRSLFNDKHLFPGVLTAAQKKKYSTAASAISFGFLAAYTWVTR